LGSSFPLESSRHKLPSFFSSSGKEKSGCCPPVYRSLPPRVSTPERFPPPPPLQLFAFSHLSFLFFPTHFEEIQINPIVYGGPPLLSFHVLIGFPKAITLDHRAFSPFPYARAARKNGILARCFPFPLLFTHRCGKDHSDLPFLLWSRTSAFDRIFTPFPCRIIVY